MSLPEAFADEWFILFSHPGDFTPVCTTEFAAFEQRREAFEELDVEIGFPIIADESGAVSEELSMIHPNAGSSTVRALFIVDPTGTIRQILYYPEEIGRNIDEILRSVDALQLADEEDVVTPADWPENERFEDRVLLPPPETAADIDAVIAEAEAEDYDQYDWWFTVTGHSEQES